MSFDHYLFVESFITLSAFVISMMVALGGLSVALFINKRRKISCNWIKSLRFILVVSSISAMSNAWAILILNCPITQPTEFFMDLSLAALGIWIILFYKYKLMPGKDYTLHEKLLKFISDQ